MQKTLLAMAASAAVLASVAAQAQQTSQDRPGMMMQQRGGEAGRPGDRTDDGRPGGMGPGMMAPGMMGPGMGMMMGQGGGPGMMGPGMMRHGRMGPRMTTIMMAIVDANGDRALSLEEIQTAHARIFKYADADNDGKLTEAELRSFFHGGEVDDDD